MKLSLRRALFAGMTACGILLVCSMALASEVRLQRNTATELAFPMIDKVTPALYKSGETVTDLCYYRDGSGAWTSLSITATAAEIGTSGIYKIGLTAGELNHDLVLCKFTASNSVDQVSVIRTIEAPFILPVMQASIHTMRNYGRK